MKKFPKTIVVMFLIAIMVSIFVLPASAATTYTRYKSTASEPDIFNNSWEIVTDCYDRNSGYNLTEIGIIS